MITHAGQRRHAAVTSRNIENALQIEALGMQSFELRHASPRRSLLLARQAVRAAERVPCNDPRIWDFRSRQWAFYGNGLRIIGDFREAAAAFSAAWERSAHGNRPAADVARLYEFEASLLNLEHQPSAAVEKLRRAADLRLETLDAPAAVRLLSKLAIIQGTADPVAGLETLVQAGEILDAEAHPVLGRDLLHNLAWLCLDAGNAHLAQEVYLILSAAGSPCSCTGRARRTRWLHGRIAASFGDLGAAISDLRGAQDDFAAAKLPLETALCGLELALYMAQAGQRGNVIEMLARTRMLFSALSLAPESRAAELLMAMTEGACYPETLPVLLREMRRDARPAPRLSQRAGTR